MIYRIAIRMPSHHRSAQRLLFALVAALALLMFSATAVSAGAAPESPFPETEPQDPVPLDRFCISGMVINHAEQPLARWTVTAEYEGVNGEYETLTDETNSRGQFEFELPGPGRWALEVDEREGWEGVTTTRLAVYVGYGHTDCIEVRFKLRELITVVVLKIDEEHTPQPGWTITATPGHGNTFGAPQTEVTDENGEASFELTPGPWIFTEEPPGDVVWWRPISPPNGVHHLVVAGPGPHTIRFKNMLEKKPKGCINVTKFDVPPDADQDSFGLAGWPIEIRRANGSIADAGVTDSFGQITFTDLPYGPYTVHEIMQPGWEPASPTHYSVVLTSRDDGCKDIIFYNKQLPKGYCFEGRKVDATGGYGLPDWEITAKPLEPGGYVPESVFTDGEGRYRVYLPMDDYRVPGAVYEVSEVIPDGWTAVSPASFLITMPEHPDICVQAPVFVNEQTKYVDEDTHCTEPCQAHPGECRAVHVVTRGDSVYRIAGRYHVAATSIFRANPWIAKQRNYWLYVGQKVCIP